MRTPGPRHRQEGLRRYGEDGRLPISDIASEHVARTIAVPRRSFLFADTSAEARASVLIYSCSGGCGDGHSTIDQNHRSVDPSIAGESNEPAST